MHCTAELAHYWLSFKSALGLLFASVPQMPSSESPREVVERLIQAAKALSGSIGAAITGFEDRRQGEDRRAGDRRSKERRRGRANGVLAQAMLTALDERLAEVPATRNDTNLHTLVCVAQAAQDGQRPDLRDEALHRLKRQLEQQLAASELAQLIRLVDALLQTSEPSA